MKKKATLNDIAKVIGLTKVSISKALRDHPDISENTKKKVKKIAEDMGYRPNLIARSLTSSRSKTLGVVVPKIAHNFFAQVVAGIQQYASSKEYEIVLTISEEDEQQERKHIETLVAMQVDGLLVSVSMETRNKEVFEWLREIQVPLVFFDRNIPGLGFNSVIIDDENSAAEGVNHLINMGCRNIAHLAGYDHVSIGRKRRIGYEKALKEKNLPLDESMIIEGGFNEEFGYEGFKKLRAKGIMPDGLLVVSFPVGLGACIAMREENPELMDNIQMMSFGDSGVSDIVSYPQFYIDQSGLAIGQRSAKLLVKEISGKIKPADHIEYIKTNIKKTGRLSTLNATQLFQTR
ncbi:MAG: LacI family DNA-binding transcriptional regulator [Balneolales bacterium]